MLPGFAAGAAGFAARFAGFAGVAGLAAAAGFAAAGALFDKYMILSMPGFINFII